MNGSSKKGSTLLELCIVMALISILLAIISSFSVSINGFTATAKKKNDVTQDYLLCKKYIESWVSRFHEGGYAMSVVPSSEGEESLTYIKATKDDGVTEYTLSTSGDGDGKVTLVMQYEQDGQPKNVTYASNVFTSIEFSADDVFIRCAMRYGDDDVMAFVIGGVL